ADRRREVVGADIESVRLELLPEPGGGASRARRPRGSLRITRGEIRRKRGGRRSVEGRREVGRLESRGAGHAECEQKQRQTDEEPGASVEAAVDRTLDGS